MFKKLRSNPILLYQMQHACWPSMQTTWLISFGLTVIGLALTIIAFTTYRDIESSLSTFLICALIWDIEVLLLFVGPLVTAGVAVAETTRSIASDKYRLIRLSPLSEWEIVNGYLANMVFRLRSLWMLAGGLLLPSIMAWAQAGLAFETFSACPPSSNYDCTDLITQLVTWDVIWDSASFMLRYAALFLGWSWLAITLGVWLAFRFRRKGIGFVVTLPSVLLTIIASLIMIFKMGDQPPMEGIVVLSEIVMAVFVLGLAAYLLTVRYVRKTTK